MVELLGGALSLAILEAVIFRMPGSASAARALAVYGADFALCLGLVAAAFIDAEHMFLPDSVTLGGVVLGIATATLRDLPLTRALFGAGAGFVGVWLPFIFLYKGLLGRTGMGMGDAKLLALAGAWFGWEGAVFVLFAGALQGTVYAAGLKILGIKPSLPQAVLEDIAELEKAAAEGDEEAKKALDEDPLTENEDDAFILRWLGLGAKKEPTAKPEGRAPEAPKTEGEAPETEGEAPETEGEAPEAPKTEEDEDAEAPRARIPFGPFLILACLELLFAGDWFAARLGPLFGPM
jgi:leader peptidase (prepilin peptidase)/N-methyltransferase